MTFYRRTSVSAVTFAGTDAPQRAQEGLVGPEFFELLGAPPLIGRTFSLEEFERGEPVVVLSEGLWQEQFARSHAVLGQTLSIDGRDHVVLGVMPRTFQLPTSDTRFWRPLSMLPGWPETQSIRDGDGIEVIGRLAPGVRFEDATAEMAVIAARLREAHAVNSNVDVRIIPLFDHVVGSRTRRGMWLGFAAVLCLLVIACANVGGLLSARAARRRRELAVRSALGAGRARLVRQLLAESVSLWAVASVAGVLLASALIRLLLAYGPKTLPRMEDVALDVAALAVAFLGGLAVVMVAGTMPALVAAKTDSAAAFVTRNQSSLPRHRLQDLLVAAQIAGTLMLLVGAVLFAQSFVRAQSEDAGYAAENLLIVRLDLPRDAYPDRPALAGFFREASDRIGRLPGVVAVGGITDFFIRRNADQWVTIEGRAVLAGGGLSPGSRSRASRQAISARWASRCSKVGTSTNGIIEPGAADVFIVNESLARRFWPGESAVGKRMVGGASPPKDGRWRTVVGVVKDMRREGLDVAPILGAFVPSFLRGMDLTIRASTRRRRPDSRRSGRRFARSTARCRSAASRPPTDGSRSGSTHAASRARRSARFRDSRCCCRRPASMRCSPIRSPCAGAKSAFALLLGADRRSIVRMILGKGVRLALAGAAVGVAGAAAAARVLQSLLYETAALNAPSYAAAAVLVLLVAATAAWVPALRAARVSPMTALRED